MVSERNRNEGSMNEPTSIELDNLSYALVQAEIEGRLLLSRHGQPDIDWQRYAQILEQAARASRVLADAELRKMRKQRDAWALGAVVLAGGLAMMAVLVIALWRMG